MEHGMTISVGDKIVGRMKEFTDALRELDTESFTCHKVTLDLQPTPYDKELVRSTRNILKASQTVFAKFLGVSVKTVRSWEQGINTPPDMACRFMDEIRRDQSYWQKRLLDCICRKSDIREAKETTGMQ
jgi:putative transcriptional regulator